MSPDPNHNPKPNPNPNPNPHLKTCLCLQDQIVLVSQFRPPTGQTCLELPAGLIDRGETPDEAALRELYEETGYRGETSDTSAVLWSDPGLTNANFRLVTININGDSPENMVPKPQPEEGECIEVMLAPLVGLKSYLDRVAAEKGFGVDARLYTMAVGMAVGQETAAAPKRSQKNDVPPAQGVMATTGKAQVSIGSGEFNELIMICAAICLTIAFVAGAVRHFDLFGPQYGVP